MRLFVALWPPPEVIEHLAPAVAALKADSPDLDGSHGPVTSHSPVASHGPVTSHRPVTSDGPPASKMPVAPLRWTRPEQWHLTLAFLAEVPGEAVPELERRLARAASRTPTLSLAFAGAGRFGDRVLFTKVTGDRDHLRRLAESVTAAARRTGLPVEDRAYRPHLTLARGRPDVDLRPLVAQLDGYRGPQWQADELHLVRSDLPAASGRTSRYVTLRSWPLNGG